MDSEKAQTLSDRECEVLELIAHGHTTGEIASLFGIEECTVRFHIKNILNVLNVNNRAQAVYYAVKRGWIA